MSNKFLRGSSILNASNTTPGDHLTKQEIECFTTVIQACRDYGCDFYPTIINKLRYDEMYEIAAYGGFPRRYPHWSWGMEYGQMSKEYEYGLMRIYEMVVNCVGLATNILTKRGSKQAHEVEVGDTVMGRDGWREVVAVERQRASEVYEMRFDHLAGAMICTPKHKWLCVRKGKEVWVEAKDMEEGEVVLAGGCYESYTGHAAAINWAPEKVLQATRARLLPIQPPAKMTCELAELMGVLTGDGSCGVRLADNVLTVPVHTSLVDYQDHISCLITKAFGREPSIYEKKASVKVIAFCSKFAVDYLDVCGWKKGSTYKTKRIPWSIWASSNEYRAAYLRGLFDTDGHCSTTLSLTCYTDELAADVQRMLLEMGIRSKLSHISNPHNDIAVLTVTGKPSVRRFLNRIGFAIGYKQEALQVFADGRGGQSYQMPGVIEEIVGRIKAIEEPPDWMSKYRRRSLVTSELYGFLYEAVSQGYKKEFGDLLKLVERPAYVLKSKELLADTHPTVDIALDHEDHDFLANGLVSHNTNPCHMYILNSNTLMDNIMVVAHATFHNDFFKNNIHFQPTAVNDPHAENMMNKLANHGSRIQKYMNRWGMERVTEFIDNVLRIHTLIDLTKIWDHRPIKDVVIRDERKYEFPRLLNVDKDRLYMDPYINTREYIDQEKERIQKREAEKELELFRGEDKDIFGFIKDYAPLKPWQQDIISMLYEEEMYFGPQRLTKCINEGWACLTFETLIVTNRGHLKVGDIVEKRLPVKVFDGSQYQPVTNWYKFEGRKTVKLITKRGYELEGSANHRVLNCKGCWKQLGEFNPGDEIRVTPTAAWPEEYQELEFSTKARLDRHSGLAGSAQEEVAVTRYTDELAACGGVITQHVRRKAIKVPERVDESLGAFLGYMVGDGHISDKKRTLGLTTGDEEARDHYQSLLTDLFGVTGKSRWDDSSPNGRWRVAVSGRNLRDLLVSLGLPTGASARIKMIPSVIWRSPKSVAAAFLRSYFDCDGCAHKNGITLATSSTELARQVQLLLLNFGILCSRRLSDKKNNGWQLYIGGQSAKVFCDEIGFGLSRKQDILNKYVTERRWFCKQKWQDEIVTVEQGCATVYDLTVENTHRYAAHGFINHNSLGDYEIMARQGYVGLGQKSHDCGIVEYAKHKMGVLGGKYSMNPYKIGFYLLLDIEERWNKGQFGPEWDECRDWNRKQNWDLKLGKGKEKVFEARKYYDDLTFILEYFTQDFCDKHEFYEWKKYPGGEMKIESRDYKKIRGKLLQRYVNAGLPDIRLTDPNHKGKGWMLLEHKWDGRALHEPYARATLNSLYYFWNREIALVTKNQNGEEQVYVCGGTDPEKDVAKVSRADYDKRW